MQFVDLTALARVPPIILGGRPEPVHGSDYSPDYLLVCLRTFP